MCFTKPTKDTVGKDVGGVKVADGKPADVPPLQRDAPKASTSSATAAAAAGSTDEVEEYKAKLAEKRRLAREKAEIEAAQQEEMRRQQQSVDIAPSYHIAVLAVFHALGHFIFAEAKVSNFCLRSKVCCET